MKIKDEILNILADCRVEGNVLFLPGEQLDRKTYEAVNKCLENIGGKWSKKAKGHVFDSDPAPMLDNLVMSGETTDLKKEYQFFPTPREIGDRLCRMAEINEHSRVLEPSAGNGLLVDAILANNPESVYMVELNPDMCQRLRQYVDLSSNSPAVALDSGDFLTKGLSGQISVNRAVMNPPFSRQQDIDHIMEAYKCLSPGGVLVSICSESPFFRTNRKSLEFTEFLHRCNAEVDTLPEGAFKESGTMVRTRIIKIRKATP